MQLSPSRVFLLVLFVPLLLRWVGGAAGRITPGDVLIGLHCLWIALALAVVHGTERIPYAGITCVELFGGYLVGRTLIRSAADYRALFRMILVGLVLLTPFLLVEIFTARMLVNEILGTVFDAFPRLAVANEKRLGLFRAQGVLEHPILLGLFCSLAIANVFYMFGGLRPGALVRTGFVTFVTFLSLSSAPLLAAMVQFGLIGWGYLTRNAWWTLAVFAVLGYAAIDLLSNRTPVTIFISIFTFSPGTAWYRIAVFDYGIQSVWAHPLFGIGLNPYERAGWMYSGSIDNFWLVVAVRYGIPGFLLLVGGILANLFGIMRARDLPAETAALRQGYVIASIGLFVTLSTVHIWGPTSVFVMCYLGAGVFMFTSAHAAAEPGTPQTATEGAAAARRAPARREAPPAPAPNPRAAAREAAQRRRLRLPLSRPP